MSTVVTPAGGSVVIQQDTSVVAQHEGGDTTVVTPQIGRGAVVVTTGAQGRRGEQGPAGGITTVTVGASPISGHSVVAVDAAGLLVPADSSNPAHRGAILGIVAGAYSPGDEAEVQRNYVMEHAGWTWTAGPMFVGLAGALSQTLPMGSVFSQTLGQALSATRVLIDLQPPITIV